MAKLCPCILPAWGMLIFLMSPGLWKKMVFPLLVSIAITVGVLVALYVPVVEEWQADQLIELFNESDLELMGYNVTDFFSEDNKDNILTTLKVVAPFEAALICFLVFMVLFGKVAGEIAMEVLENRGTLQKFREAHNLEQVQESSGGAMGAGFMILSIILLLATLSFNFIPFIGQIIFVFANGWLFAWSLVTDLLPIIGYNSCGNQVKHVLCHPFSYVLFGAVCFAINIIPIVGQLCTGGIACGTALLFEGFLEENSLGSDFVEGEPPSAEEGTQQALLPAAAPRPPAGPPAPGAAPPPAAAAAAGASRAGSASAASASAGAAPAEAPQGGMLAGLFGQAQDLARTGLEHEKVQKVVQDERVQRMVQKVAK